MKQEAQNSRTETDTIIYYHNQQKKKQEYWLHIIHVFLNSFISQVFLGQYTKIQKYMVWDICMCNIHMI